MQLKKTLVKLFIGLIVFFLSGLIIKAEQINDQSIIDEQKIMNYSINLLDWQSIEALEDQLQAATPKIERFDLKEQVTALMKGETKLTLEGVIGQIGKLFLGEIGLFIQLGARFILIVLLCNLLQTLSSSFESKDTVKIGFFVCYMAILLSVIQSFSAMIQLAQTTIDQVLQVMYICIPTLLAFMTTTGYAASAAAMAPVIISALSLVTYIIKVIILPCIVSVVVLEVISAMSETFKVDKFVSLFYKGLKWALCGVLLLAVSMLGMYRMTLPYVDLTVKKATLKFSTAFIPIVGDAVEGAVDFLMNCSGLIKNTFSAGVIIWLLVIVSLPLIKIFSYVLVYHVAGAVIEPIGDKNMAGIATKLGKGCEFIMSAVGIVALLGVCCLVICMSVGVQMA